MSYTGPERRLKQNVDCPVGGCPMSNETHTTIEVLKNDMMYVKGSVKSIDDKINKVLEAESTRVAKAVEYEQKRWQPFIGTVALFLIQTIILAFFIGGLSKQVDVNTHDIKIIKGELVSNQRMVTSTILEN